MEPDRTVSVAAEGASYTATLVQMATLEVASLTSSLAEQKPQQNRSFLDLVGLHRGLRGRGEQWGQAQFLELRVQVGWHCGDHRVMDIGSHLQLT